MKLRKTKTFIQNRWFDRRYDGVFEEAYSPTGEDLALDEQIARWVAETGNVITHPGQPGVHSTFYGDADNPYKMRCMTIALTVLYISRSELESRDVGGTREHCDNTRCNAICTGYCDTTSGANAKRASPSSIAFNGSDSAGAAKTSDPAATAEEGGASGSR